MKKGLYIITAIILLLTLCSCGGGKTKDTSDAMYQIGLNSLEAADRYIAGEITGDEAADLLEEYHKQAEAQCDAELKEVGKDTLVGTVYSNDSLINSYIFLLKSDISASRYGSRPMSDVRESRDDLAAKLGK